MTTPTIGNDSIVGTSGNDTIDALAGNDTVLGGNGNDSIFGGAGNDSLDGGNGFDTVDGGSGNDTVRGSSSADSLLGGEGNDSLLGGDGGDTLEGGAGADTIDGGSGFDAVSYANAASGVVFSRLNTSLNTGDAAGDQIGGISRLIGSSFDDTITGFNVTFGGGGDDIITPSAGGTAFGENGNDTFIVTTSSLSLDGGVGFDLVSFAGRMELSVDLLDPSLNTGSAAFVSISGIEAVVGTDFNDTIEGDSLGNLLSAGIGNDSLNGRDGNDTLAANGFGDTLDGGAGTDTADLDIDALRTGAWAVNVLLDVQNIPGSTLALAGFSAAGIENWSVDFGSSVLNDTFVGGDGNDTALGGAGNDSLGGRIGNDSLNGGDGNDTLAANGFGDTLVGGTGTDTADLSVDALRTGAWAVNVLLDVQNIPGSTLALAGFSATGIENWDVDFGTSVLNDTFVGGDANDTALGGGGNDSLGGRVGNDSLSGGNGNDTLSANGFGDTLDGGAGTDTAVLDVDALRSGPWAVDVILNVSDIPGSTLALAGFSAIGIERWDVDFGVSVLNDTFVGGTGNDTTRGGGGADSLSGAGGADRIGGGAGNDTLAGGTGADVFVFADAPAAGGIDRVTDFSGADDQIEIDASQFGGGLVAGQTVTLVANTAPSAVGITGPVFLYDTDAGWLSFDADGQGGGSAVTFLLIQNLATLSTADFTVVA